MFYLIVSSHSRRALDMFPQRILVISNHYHTNHWNYALQSAHRAPLCAHEAFAFFWAPRGCTVPSSALSCHGLCIPSLLTSQGFTKQSFLNEWHIHNTCIHCPLHKLSHTAAERALPISRKCLHIILPLLPTLHSSHAPPWILGCLFFSGFLLPHSGMAPSPICL